MRVAIGTALAVNYSRRHQGCEMGRGAGYLGNVAPCALDKVKCILIDVDKCTVLLLEYLWVMSFW